MHLAASCTACTVDKYCGQRGMISSEALNCGNGFICKAGSMAAEPTTAQQGDLCPAGHFCSVLTVGKEVCAVGDYQPNTGQGSCIGCHGGYLCTDTGYPADLSLRPTICGLGKYCPAQTVTVNNAELDCPAGYYSGITGVASIDDCVQCPVGKYCIGGKLAPDGDCDAGFFCPKGQSTKTFATDYEFGAVAGGKCPTGHFCLAGAYSPTPCPYGTYSDTSGNVDDTKCLKCPGGYYCDEYGLTNKIIKSRNKICDAGYYCTEGAIIPHPEDKVTGGKCTPGNYCPPNSIKET